MNATNAVIDQIMGNSRNRNRPKNNGESKVCASIKIQIVAINSPTSNFIGLLTHQFLMFSKNSFIIFPFDTLVLIPGLRI